MIEQLEARQGFQGYHELEPTHEKELLLIGHTYQPHREVLLPTSGERVKIVPEVNEVIAEECHKKIFMERTLGDGTIEKYIPDGLTFSFGAPLRDWFIENDPETWQKIKENVDNLPNKEYKALGDTYIHAILPLLPEEDQDTLVKIGLKAFENDFGFKPKGAWLAETAVSQTTLRVLHKNGYEFVVLRDDQLNSAENNPIYFKVEENGEEIGEIAAIHFFKDMNTSISFEDQFTANGDDFLERAKTNPKKVISAASDTEFYGHHKKNGKIDFLSYVTKPTTLKRHGFEVFDAKKALSNPDHKYTTLNEFTSWSCNHELGRWTGAEACNCGVDHSPSEERKGEKRWLTATLANYSTELNKLLSQENHNWREEFVLFFLGIREPMFSGKKTLSGNENPLMLAKMCQLIGMTSCGWFFEDDGRIETQLNHAMNSEIPKLIEKSKNIDLPKAA